MKIVVTGSEGFIGKALVPYLEAKGHEVVRVDKKLKTDFHHVQWWGVDAIVHLAAQTSVWNRDLYGIEQDNIRFFMQAVDMSNATGAKLIYASSSCANDKNITSMYGLSKKFDEDYAQMYARWAIGLRFHNVYGPNPREDTLPGILLKASKTGKEVKLYNGGGNVRHYTYIDDVCEAILFALTECEVGKIYNVFNPEKMTTWEFAEHFMDHADVNVVLVDEARELDKDYQYVCGDLYSILCKTDVRNGLRKMFEKDRG